MDESPRKVVVNVDDVEEREHLFGEHWGGSFKPLTPSMKPGGGSLGMNRVRVPPGRACVPFHFHQLEDEIFYILSGTGVLRYGEALIPLRPGDTISCPAGTGVAHQIFNNGDADLEYLAVGPSDPNEVCVYPDTGKVLVRSIKSIGYLEKTEYMAGEPDVPRVLGLVESMPK